MRQSIDRWLIDRWSRRWHRFWSVRIALFWGAVCGLVAVWSSFSDVLPLWVFAGASVVMNMALAVARLTKQPGADE